MRKDEQYCQAMLPFARVCGFGWKKTRTCHQLLPSWPANEPFTVQNPARGVQLSQTTSWNPCQLARDDCGRLWPAPATWALHRPTKPSTQLVRVALPEPPNLMGKDARLCARVVRSWSPERVSNKAFHGLLHPGVVTLDSLKGPKRLLPNHPCFGG